MVRREKMVVVKGKEGMIPSRVKYTLILRIK